MKTTVLPSISMRLALLQHARVVLALMLRDIKTRFGASYFGFLFGLILPLGHIGIVLAVYVILGRRAPIGTDVSLYLASAIVPFVIWSYTHQKVLTAFAQNRALTSFPIVGFIDIVIARALVELVNAAIILGVVAATFVLLGVDIFVFDRPSFTYSLFLSYAMGVSTGFVLGIIGMVVPGIMLVGILMVPLYWVTSGVLFIPEALPEQVRWMAAIFPLCHIVDFGRSAFYPNYLTDFPNLFYVHAVIVLNVLAGMVFTRYVKRLA